MFILLTIFILLNANPGFAFNSINDNNNKSKVIDRLIKLEIINMIPDDYITRSEFVKIIIKSMGLGDAVKLAPQKSNFSDVTTDHWAINYIKLANDEGLVGGYPDGSFKPDKTITYSEALSIVIRALGYGPVIKGNWPEDILKATYLNLTTNVGQFNPNSNVSWGDAAQIIDNSLEIPIIINNTNQNNNNISTNPSTKKECFLDKLLTLNKETEHFLFYSLNNDINTIDDLADELENNFERVTGDLRKKPAEKITVKVYPDIQLFHNAVGNPNAPDWAIGLVKNRKIHMVSPLNPGPEHTYKSVLHSIVHEFTHIVIREINPRNIPVWLNEGVASYEGRNIINIKTIISSDIIKSVVPSLSELNNRERFVDLKGYEYSYTMVEYLVHQYGYDKLVELIKTPENIENILGLTEENLYQRWLNYLKQNYTV